MDALLKAKVIDPGLSEVKHIALKALEEEYASRDEALESIAEMVRG